MIPMTAAWHGVTGFASVHVAVDAMRLGAERPDVRSHGRAHRRGLRPTFADGRARRGVIRPQ